LKRRERLSARLGDILSQLYLISATLKRFEDDGRPEADLALVRWGIEDALVQARLAFEGLLANYPHRGAAALLRALAFPFGMTHVPSTDALGSEVALVMQTPGETRDRLLAGSHVSSLKADPISGLEKLLTLTPALSALESRLRESKLALPASPDEWDAWAQSAVEQGSIDADEHALLLEWAALARDAVKVDDFSADFGILEALQRRSAALEGEMPEIVA
jgi:acyl-CoA dehydrogenase